MRDVIGECCDPRGCGNQTWKQDEVPNAKTPTYKGNGSRDGGGTDFF